MAVQESFQLIFVSNQPYPLTIHPFQPILLQVIPRHTKSLLNWVRLAGKECIILAGEPPQSSHLQVKVSLRSPGESSLDIIVIYKYTCTRMARRDHQFVALSFSVPLTSVWTMDCGLLWSGRLSGVGCNHCKAMAWLWMLIHV